MAAFPAIKLHFASPLHLSHGRQDEGDSQHWLPSDTLSAALVACAVELFGYELNAESFLKGFRVSSAFPFCGEEFFFPKPLLDALEIAESDERKLEKQVAWYGKTWFEAWLNGSKTAFSKKSLSENRRFLTDDATAQKAEFIKTTVEQRVAVPRFGDGELAEPQTFYQERLYFERGAGLFFLFEIKNEAHRAHFEAALRLLGENGLGSDRTSGNGLFEPEKFDLEIDASKATRHIALSLVCPKRDEINEEKFKKSGYQLIQRGGYLASPANESWTRWRKKSVWMFREGSVFEQIIDGGYVDLQPRILEEQGGRHPIWRDGRGFFISIS